MAAVGPKLCAASTLLVLLGASAPAWAQLRDGLGSNLETTFGVMTLKNKTMEPGLAVRPPDALAGAKIRLDGSFGFIGGALRETFVFDNMRISLGVGLATMRGEASSPQRAPGGLEVRARSPWAGIFDLAIGRQLRFGPVLPYFDIRITQLLISSNVELRSQTEGLLNVSAYLIAPRDIGPRMGFWLPLSGFAHLDFSARVGLFGPERFGIDLGLGFYLPFRRTR